MKLHQRGWEDWEVVQREIAKEGELGSIHSKSEFRNSNETAKKFELSANLSKNTTKWPKNGQK